MQKVGEIGVFHAVVMFLKRGSLNKFRQLIKPRRYSSDWSGSKLNGSSFLMFVKFSLRCECY